MYSLGQLISHSSTGKFINVLLSASYSKTYLILPDVFISCSELCGSSQGSWSRSCGTDLGEGWSGTATILNIQVNIRFCNWIKMLSVYGSLTDLRVNYIRCEKKVVIKIELILSSFFVAIWYKLPYVMLNWFIV